MHKGQFFIAEVSKLVKSFLTRGAGVSCYILDAGYFLDTWFRIQDTPYRIKKGMIWINPLYPPLGKGERIWCGKLVICCG